MIESFSSIAQKSLPGDQPGTPQFLLDTNFPGRPDTVPESGGALEILGALVSPAKSGELPDVDPEQLGNLRFLAGLAAKIREARQTLPYMEALFESVSADDAAEMMRIYRDFRPSNERLEAIHQQAANLAHHSVENPAIQAIAQNWSDYNADERKEALESVLGDIRNSIGLPDNVTIEFFSAERTATNNEYIAIYDPRGYKIKFNVHPTATTYFSEAISSIFHEAVHAIDDIRTRNVHFHLVDAEYESGNITYEDALYRVNSLIYADIGMSFKDPDSDRQRVIDQIDYLANPLEFAAFSGEALVRHEMNEAGFFAPPRLPSWAPVMQFLRENGFFDSDPAMPPFG